MSKGAKDADVDRLTRREIEEYLGMLDGADMILDVEQSFMKRLCDLALQSLSQDAVREEVLEKAAKIAEAAVQVKHAACSSQPMGSMAGYSGEHIAECPYAIADAIRALKREPNAAAWDRSTERASGERTSAGTSPSPAPAAPDVASMVKRLRNYANESGGAQVEQDLLEAAALLARLGQGWIPPETVIEIDEDGNVHPAGVNLKGLRHGASDE